jgi:hypothetical protein
MTDVSGGDDPAGLLPDDDVVEHELGLQFEQMQQHRPLVTPAPAPVKRIDALVLQYVRERLLAGDPPRRRSEPCGPGEGCWWDRPGGCELFICRRHGTVHICDWGAFGVMRCSYHAESENDWICALTGTVMGRADMLLEPHKQWVVQILKHKPEKKEADALALAPASPLPQPRTQPIRKADTMASVRVKRLGDQSHELHSEARRVVGRITDASKIDDAARDDAASWCLHVWKQLQSTSFFLEHSQKLDFERVCVAVAYRLQDGFGRDGRVLPKRPDIAQALVSHRETCKRIRPQSKIRWITQAIALLQIGLQELEDRHEKALIL